MSDTRILAAGGILWRTSERRELALVHRHRYDDWSLPKGKLQPTEGFERAAVREVTEETGFEPAIVGYAGEMCYDVAGTPKTVIMFEMEPLSAEPSHALDPDEVREIAWLTPESALEKMTYDLERELLRRVCRR